MKKNLWSSGWLKGDMLVGSARTFVLGLLIIFALSALALMGRQIWRDRQTRGIMGNGSN